MRRSRIVCLFLFLAVFLLALVFPRPAETDDLAGLTASARAGDVPACLLLGRLALEGIAMPQSDAAAAGWIRLAAGQGNAGGKLGSYGTPSVCADGGGGEVLEAGTG